MLSHHRHLLAVGLIIIIFIGVTVAVMILLQSSPSSFLSSASSLSLSIYIYIHIYIYIYTYIYTYLSVFLLQSKSQTQLLRSTWPPRPGNRCWTRRTGVTQNLLHSMNPYWLPEPDPYTLKGPKASTPSLNRELKSLPLCPCHFRGRRMGGQAETETAEGFKTPGGISEQIGLGGVGLRV